MIWQQLYVQTTEAESVAAALVATLSGLGYTRYDPFYGGSGTPPTFKHFARHFVAPAAEGWVRILGYPLPDTLRPLIAKLSEHHALIYAQLDSRESTHFLTVYRANAIHDLGPYLRTGKTLDDLRQAHEGSLTTKKPVRGGSGLPPELEKMARDGNVNPDQAGKLMNRLSSQLFGRLNRQSGGEADTMKAQAQALVSGANVAEDWNSEAGQRLMAMIDLLTLPAAWREPSFEALKDAYQSARMLRKNPNASLMPDERQAIKAIPDAGEYVAVYMGKA